MCQKINRVRSHCEVCVRTFEASAMATVFSDVCLRATANEMLMLAKSESQQISRNAETFPQSSQKQAGTPCGLDLLGHVNTVAPQNTCSQVFKIKTKKTKKRKIPSWGINEVEVGVGRSALGMSCHSEKTCPKNLVREDAAGPAATVFTSISTRRGFF